MINGVEYAYKLTVVYYEGKRVSKLLTAKNPDDMERVLKIKSAHEADDDVESVTLYRTRAPRRLKDNQYWQEGINNSRLKLLNIDESGAVATPAETALASDG